MLDTKYAYALGRIRVLETRLLDAGKIDRMVEAKTAAEALKILSESEYAPHLANLENVNQFEQVLAAERSRIYKLLRSMLPETGLVDMFARQFDYHNLKVLLKAQKLGEKHYELLVPDVGNIPLDELLLAVKSGDFQSLPPRMRRAAESCLADFHPQLVDIRLDVALYEDYAALAKRYRSRFLREYFTFLADLINIKTFIRIMRLKHSADFLAEALLPAGELDLTVLSDSSEPLAALTEHLAKSRYARIVQEGVKHYRETGTLTRYEKLADNFLLQHLKQSKYVVLGPEPVIAYLLAKENEIKLVRIIMVGKINRLPTEEIRERLRDVYV